MDMPVFAQDSQPKRTPLIALDRLSECAPSIDAQATDALDHITDAYSGA